MPFLAAGAGIGAVGSIVGGGKQAGAARDAAHMQSQAATHAADLQNAQFQQTLQNEQPWMNAGSHALDVIQGDLTGLTRSFDPAEYGLFKTFNPAQFGIANSFSYDPTSFQNDPAFQSAMKLSQQAVQRSAAAKGQVLDPSTLKSLTQYATDYGNQYYGQDYARAQDTFNQNYNRAQQTYNSNYGNAFNTFTANQSNSFNKLAQLAGLGQSATNQAGAFGAQAATNAGNMQVGAANAGSAGIIGAANGFNNAFGGASANLAQLLGNSQFQGWAKGTGNTSSYQTMTPYTPTFPVNSDGI